MGNQLQRRQFLKLLLISGIAAGCSRAIPDEPEIDANEGPPTPPDTSTTLALDLRFHLERDAAEYRTHPDGCDRTTIWGTVRDANGNALSGIVVQVWPEDESWIETMVTDAEGAYKIDVAEEVSDATYLVQLRDQAGTTLLSDVTVVQAIPRCELNLMIVNFVASF